MKRLIILGIIVCVGLLVGSAAVIGKPAGPPGGLDVSVVTVYRFAGYSTDATTGSAGGIIGMHSICQDTFGPNARMCTTEEFWRSPRLATPGPTTVAWVNPTIAVVYYDANADHPVCIDYSGKQFYSCDDDTTRCDQWRAEGASFYGTIVQSSTGQVTDLECSTSLPVTCCLPASQSL